MKHLFYILLILSFSCKNKADSDTNNNIANGIVLNLDKTTLLIKGVTSINDSTKVNNDYDIKKNSNQITITPLFLESDLLDNKEIEIIGDEFSKIEIIFTYDAIFSGEEKRDYTLNFKTDTLLNIDIKNRHFFIPNSDEIKKHISKKFDLNKVIEKSYLINYYHYQDIIKNPDRFGTSDYKYANEFLNKKQSDFKSLEELLTEIDYSKITIKLFKNNREEYTIVYDRGFKKSELDFDKVNRITNDYYNLESILLNLKSNKYKVEVLERTDLKDKENVQHNSNPIVILQKQDKDYIRLKENAQLIFDYDDNCPTDGFTRIVSKNEYFTIEQTFCSDFKFVNSYTTFRIDENTNEIYLHKYGEEYTDRSNPDKDIPSKILTTKYFGKVKFEDVNEYFLKNLRQNKTNK
ncbi:hypothetical protein [Flavobacterium piscis]|uniref:DUF4221 domain-containing protein n=1 Tax=Flavobacterium piscis TaxID=1114874 RepID=A0ABU1YB72_9FLAO|nr:hypothetical protein [Flavobacterium piscis]MDR7211464.1 hypothetical protein [Flavobacterium piscis]